MKAAWPIIREGETLRASRVDVYAGAGGHYYTYPHRHGGRAPVCMPGRLVYRVNVRMKPAVVTFHGSYGEFDVDAKTGHVVKQRPDHEAIKDEGGTCQGYLDIVQVDLEERRDWYAARGEVFGDVQPDGDVLDVGFWTDKGAYIEPAIDWREDRLAEREGLRS